MPRTEIIITEKLVTTIAVDGLSPNEIYDLENDDHVKSLWISDFLRGCYGSNVVGSTKTEKITNVSRVA